MIEWFGLYASSVWHKVKTLLMKLGKYVVTQIKLLNYRESIKKLSQNREKNASIYMKNYR